MVLLLSAPRLAQQCDVVSLLIAEGASVDLKDDEGWNVPAPFFQGLGKRLAQLPGRILDLSFGFGSFSGQTWPKTPLNGSGSENGVERT